MRKVGNFVSEQTGESDYLDVSRTKDLSKAISPLSFSIVGNGKKDLLIEFKLDNIDSLKTIVLFGRIEYEGKIYKSEEISFEEYEFAEELFHAIEEDKTIDDTALIKEAKKTIQSDICNILTSSLDGHMILNVMIPVVGYVLSKGSKVLTIDSIVSNSYNHGSLNIELFDCVGDTTISKLVEPTIEIYFNKTKLTISNIKIINENDNIIKSFNIESQNTSFSQINEEIENFDHIPLDMNREESVNEFIKNRRTKLDNFDSNDDDLSMFDDIF